MSRSKRLPIEKDKPRNFNIKQWYWGKIRKRISSEINRMLAKYPSTYDNNNIYEQDLPLTKEIVNDWDYSEGSRDFRGSSRKCLMSGCNLRESQCLECKKECKKYERK